MRTITITLSDEHREGDLTRFDYKLETSPGLSLADVEQMFGLIICTQGDMAGVSDMEVMKEIFGYIQDLRDKPEDQRTKLPNGNTLKGMEAIEMSISMKSLLKLFSKKTGKKR